MRTKTLLPTTPEAFDTLVANLAKEYGFKDLEQVAAVLSVAIRHLPNEQDYATYQYLAGCVRKNLANGVCYHKAQAMQHKAWVQGQKDILINEPNNQQARDELEKSANEGSELAKAVLLELDKKPLSVVK